MSTAFTAVDLPSLPFPAAVEALDFETILAAMLANLVALDSSFTALVESDPAYKILQVAAYRELLMRQRVNEAIKAVTLAYAVGADLDQIAARYNVARLLLEAGDATAIPPVPPVYEDDVSLRRRVQLSFEGFSTAGPAGAYVFHCLGADSNVLDAAVNSPSAGSVTVAVLSRVGNGAASPDLVAAVNSALQDDDVRPLTDKVTVQSASIVEYSIEAVLTTFTGPDSSVVMQAAQDAAQAYADANRRIGRSITVSGVYAALQQAGVQNVALAQPVGNIVCDWNQAPSCTAIILTYGGTGV